MRILLQIEHLAVERGDIEVKQLFQGLCEERLTGAAVGLVGLSDAVIHQERRPGARGTLVGVQQVAQREELVHEALRLLVALLVGEALARYLEGVHLQIGALGVGRVGELLLDLLAPVEAARINKVAEEVGGFRVGHLQPEAGRLAVVHRLAGLPLDAEHRLQLAEVVGDDRLAPDAGLQRVVAVEVQLVVLAVTVHQAVLEVEVLRAGRVGGEVRIDGGQRREVGGGEGHVGQDQVPHAVLQTDERVLAQRLRGAVGILGALGPELHELAHVARALLVDDVVLHAHDLRLLVVVVLQDGEAVEPEELVQAGGIDLVAALAALLRGLRHPELGLDGTVHQVEVVVHRRVVLAPVAEVLRGPSTIISHILQALRKPACLHFHILQGLLRATSDTSRVEVGDVDQFAGIEDDGQVVVLVETGGLGVEPHGAVAAGRHAEGVALSGAEHGTVVARHAAVGTGARDVAELLRLPVFILLALILVELLVGLAQLLQAVDVVGGLGSLGEVHEAPLLVGLVGAVHLVEAVGLAFLRVLDEALAQEDGERVVGVELLDAAVLYLAQPLQGVPVEPLAGVAGHHGAEDLQLAVGELADLVVPLPLQLVLLGGTLRDAGEVLVGRELVADAELLGDGQHRRAEAGAVPSLQAHPGVDTVQVFIVAPEVVDHPETRLVPADGGRGGLLGEAHFELFLRVHAVTGLRIEV